jgi:hypothetical protein
MDAAVAGTVYSTDSVRPALTPTPRDVTARRTDGVQAGCKVSRSEGNSEQLTALYAAVRRLTEPVCSGWGPGGRRFKSCLPDKNLLQIALFS